jgi:hypothetical protein
VQFSNLATRRLRDPANRCRRALRARSARICGAGLELARRRACAPSFLLRPRAPVRARAAPRRRPRSSERNRRARACRGSRHIRRHGAHRREDPFDRDALRIHRDARAPGVDRRQPRDARDRGRRRRHRGAERRGRSRRAVRLPRPAAHGRGPGLRGSADVPSGSSLGRCAGGATRAGRHASCRARDRRRACPGAGRLRARGAYGRHAGDVGCRGGSERRGNRRGECACGERSGGGGGPDGRASSSCKGRAGRGRSRRRRRADSRAGARNRRAAADGASRVPRCVRSRVAARDPGQCRTQNGARDSTRASRPATRVGGRSCGCAAGRVPLSVARREAVRRQTYHG